ncbi:hypothetical protein ACQ4LE_002993 [Meloidogyne hapla]|uniref:NAC domain-containing protein n=1 Tax=Meloidogyne hapla TaxID=6305 RepID=A0A1I8C105_MELHA
MADSDSVNGYKIIEGDTITYYSQIPPTCSASEVAEKLNLEPVVLKFLEKLEYDEEETFPILIIDYLQMSKEQKQIINHFMVEHGTPVGTSGTVFKFDSWTEFFKARDELRAGHFWPFYSDLNLLLLINGQWATHSKVQTASTIVLESYPENRFLISDIQFFQI